MSDFSLADLSELDTSDVEEIRFEQLPSGIYEFIIQDAQLNEGTNKDQEKIFYAECKCKVEEVVTVLEPNVDKESLIGKFYNWRQNIEPAEADKGIGRIKAFIADVGCDNKGKMKEIVERLNGHRFKAKIVKQKDKTDPSIEYARLRFDTK